MLFRVSACLNKRDTWQIDSDDVVTWKKLLISLQANERWEYFMSGCLAWLLEAVQCSFQNSWEFPSLSTVLCHQFCFNHNQKFSTSFSPGSLFGSGSDWISCFSPTRTPWGRWISDVKSYNSHCSRASLHATLGKLKNFSPTIFL